MSSTSPTEFTERWDNHIRENRFERSRTPHRDPCGALYDAIPVHYPSADDAEAFYDPEGDVVFVEFDGRVRTSIALSDRAEWEQEYVHNQVSDQ